MDMPYKNFLKKAIDVMEKFNDSNMLAGMSELLTAKQKTWAKAKLKSGPNNGKIFYNSTSYRSSSIRALR